MINAAGKLMTLCVEHQIAYWRARKPKGENALPMREKLKRAPSPQHQAFVLIDSEAGEIWRVTAVREHIERDAEKLNQHILPILKRGGARIVTIKERARKPKGENALPMREELKRAPSPKHQEFVLIDSEAGEIWRVTAVCEHIERDAEKLNQYMLPILKRGGARIVTIKERA